MVVGNKFSLNFFSRRSHIIKLYNYNNLRIQNRSHLLYGKEIIDLLTIKIPRNPDLDLSDLQPVTFEQRLSDFQEIGKEFIFSIKTMGLTPYLEVKPFSNEYYVIECLTIRPKRMPPICPSRHRFRAS